MGLVVAVDGFELCLVGCWVGVGVDVGLGKNMKMGLGVGQIFDFFYC